MDQLSNRGECNSYPVAPNGGLARVAPKAGRRVTGAKAGRGVAPAKPGRRVAGPKAAGPVAAARAGRRLTKAGRPTGGKSRGGDAAKARKKTAARRRVLGRSHGGVVEAGATTGIADRSDDGRGTRGSVRGGRKPARGDGKRTGDVEGTVGADRTNDADGTGEVTTRERLVEAARDLFWERGYGATSLADILDRADVNSGSLYYLFRNKEDLLLAVLESYKGLLRPVVIDPAMRLTSDPVERVFAVFGVYRALLVKSSFRTGCPIGNLALELGEAPERVRRLLAANFEGWCAGIEGLLKDAGDRFAAGFDAAAFARFALTVMEGAVMQARTHQNIEAFDECVGQLRDYLSRLQIRGPGAPAVTDALRAIAEAAGAGPEIADEAGRTSETAP